MVKILFGYMLLGMLFFYSVEIMGQGKIYNGPDDPAGDIAAQRIGHMNGNDVLAAYQNNTEIGDWPYPESAVWPNNLDGLNMHDDIGLLISARVFLRNDTIPVTNPAQIAVSNNLDTLYYLQTHYREQMDQNPAGTIDWGFYPVFGYFNVNSETPAMSNDPGSWPPGGWPAQGNTKKWAGQWDGRFGKGVIYPDLACYFVANDAQDQEYLQPGLKVKYYPRPGVKIGDKMSSVTIQKGDPWGGIGIRVEQRGMQWNNPQTRDAIFWEYNIANISDYDLPQVAFGYWVNTGVGGVYPERDIGYFNKSINMAYSWNYDGVGLGGIPTGTMGFAFLESPGVSTDGKDNNNNGMIDESRDNPAEGPWPNNSYQKSFRGPIYEANAKSASYLQKYYGVPPVPPGGVKKAFIAAHIVPGEDSTAFLKFFGYQSWDDVPAIKQKEWWPGDENGDWVDGNDANHDGKYDNGEDAGDDVGTDGIGPNDLNYTGPDANGTECNHKPDYIEGIGSEPNFDETDVGESDMLGLTMFDMFPNPPKTPIAPWFKNDEVMWDLLTSTGLVAYTGEITNLIEVFATGIFPLYKGRNEHISMSEVFSYDNVAGLNSAQHSAPSLFEKEKIVDFIYRASYRFEQPPVLPTLHAKAGNGKVYLWWDDKADKDTRQAMLGGTNDFEGYKLYRSTDPYFQDAETITNGYGSPSAKEPIFQCDLKDGKEGFTNYGLINGLSFYLGDDSGIKHYYVDNNLENGRTYYYALVAYNYGINGNGVSIAPAENNAVVNIDSYGNIKLVGQNVKIVTPHQVAAGYVDPSIKMDESNNTIGNEQIVPIVYDINALKNNHTYKIKFDVDTVGHLRPIAMYRSPFDILYTDDGYTVYDVTDNNSIVHQENPQNFILDNITSGGIGMYYGSYLNPSGITSDVFDGIQLKINMTDIHAVFDSTNSGWIKGNAPISVIVNQQESIYFPWEYDIVFTNNDTAYTGKTDEINQISDGDNNPLGPTQLLFNQGFNFYVLNKSFPNSNGQYPKMDLVIYDVNKDGKYEPQVDKVLVGTGIPVLGGKHYRWGGTVFSIGFQNIKNQSAMPKPNDVYKINFKRPYVASDSLMFTIKPAQNVTEPKMQEDMQDIKVVPNPYVATNAMEPAEANPGLNQKRRILFTHIPANCTIKIFTSSGVFIKQINVSNAPDNGTVEWNLLTKENLEIAAGIYIYQVKSNITGNTKFGKFAVLK